MVCQLLNQKEVPVKNLICCIPPKVQTALLLMLTALSLSARQQDLPAVRVEKPAPISDTEEVTYVGTAAPSAEADLVTRVSGTLQRTCFAEGAKVKAGQLLFQIEDTVYKANVAIADAALEQAAAELKYAQSEYERYKSLVAADATSRTAYESAVRTYSLCKAKFSEAQARLKLAENDLSYTRITAPFSGKIGAALISTGNYVTPSSGPLAQIIQFDPIEIRFSMSEADFYKICEDGKLMTSNASIYKADGTPLKGKLQFLFVNNLVDSRTNTVEIRVAMPNPEMEIIPGGYVTVKIRKRYTMPRLSIPSSAVMTDGKNYFVYLVRQDGTVEEKKVTPGALVRDRQAILSGLTDRDVVIVGGLHKAAPGKKVRPVFNKPAAAR